MNKIFRPLFTTKPTVKGTELRLSYDIVKMHGGIESGTKEGEGTAFMIILPV